MISRRRAIGIAAARTTTGLTGTSVADFASGTSGSITLPATMNVGDVILLAAMGNPSSAPATPSGFSVVDTASVAATGAFVGMFVKVFSKVAVAGDIGASVAITGMSGSWPWSLLARSYTSVGGIDTSAVASVNGTPLATPTIPASTSNEIQVTFWGMLSQNHTINTTLASGGSDALTHLNATGYQYSAVEDWLLGSAGSTVSGGGVSSLNSSPSIAAVSITLFQ